MNVYHQVSDGADNTDNQHIPKNLKLQVTTTVKRKYCPKRYNCPIPHPHKAAQDFFDFKGFQFQHKIWVLLRPITYPPATSYNGRSIPRQYFRNSEIVFLSAPYHAHVRWERHKQFLFSFQLFSMQVIW